MNESHARAVAAALGHAQRVGLLQYARDSKPQLRKTLKGEYDHAAVLYKFWVPDGPDECALMFWLENGVPHFGICSEEIPLKHYTPEFIGLARQWRADVLRECPEASVEVFEDLTLRQVTTTKIRRRVVVVKGS